MRRNHQSTGATNGLARRHGGWRKPTMTLLGMTLLVGALPACGASGNASSGTTSGNMVRVVAVENFWGSIVRQEAGSHAQVTSVIVNPNIDPHAYEPTASDARLIAGAQYVVLNGAGYDPWAQKLLAANPVQGRRVLNVGDLVGKKEGDNPHMWYSPAYVTRVAAQVTADLKALDPGNAAYFDRQHARFMNVTLKPYRQEISLIVQRYNGVPVGATESIFQYLAQALHLNLTTPYGFLKAISEGTEPAAQDRKTVDTQVAQRQIKVLVFNSQNSTPDVNALLTKARQEHIPIVPMTETLQPATASFQAWQLAQLKALQHALAKATGR